MNRTLTESIRRQLMPALEQNQGWTGTYTRGAVSKSLIAVPVEPDWESEDVSGKRDLWASVLFIVSADRWNALRLGYPEPNDRFTVTLADGVQRTYALLAEKGKRPFDMPAHASHYNLRMKWVKA